MTFIGQGLHKVNRLALLFKLEVNMISVEKMENWVMKPKWQWGEVEPEAMSL